MSQFNIPLFSYINPKRTKTKNCVLVLFKIVKSFDYLVKNPKDKLFFKWAGILSLDEVIKCKSKVLDDKAWIAVPVFEF